MVVDCCCPRPARVVIYTVQTRELAAGHDGTGGAGRAMATLAGHPAGTQRGRRRWCLAWHGIARSSRQQLEKLRGEDGTLRYRIILYYYFSGEWKSSGCPVRPAAVIRLPNCSSLAAFSQQHMPH